MNDLSDKLAAFTIVSNNYLHYARSLMESVRAHEPDIHRFVMVLDTPVAQEALDDTGLYSVIRVEQLDLPDPKKFLFRYNVLEANTAVKPWVMEQLSREKGYKAVIYLDPDIYLYRSLTDVKEQLDSGATLVLTPHLMGPVEDDKRPSEQDILRAGAYNLGFAAIGEWRSAETLVKWWQRRLERHCVVDPDKALFVDQKWMDLAPGLFPGVSILRHKGYNVAYWNLHERPVYRKDNKYFADGDPLHFFHFSGLNVNDPVRFSKHQSRFKLEDIGDAQDLVIDYCHRLKANGADYFSKLPYGFSLHNSKHNIPDAIRRIYRNNPEVEAAWGRDPFSNDLTPFLNAFADYDRRPPRMTRLMRGLWKERPDLQAAFPKPEQDDRVRYTAWFVKNAASQLNLPDRWIAPARAQLNAYKQQENQSRIPTVVDEVVNLFDLYGEDFVRRAYQLILGRAADADGLRNFTEQLERGGRSRRRVMWALAFSDEAKQKPRRFSELAAFSLPLPLVKIVARRTGGQSPKYLHGSSDDSSPQAPIAGKEQQATCRHTKFTPGSEKVVRIIGYLDMPTGVGESARRCIAAAEAIGLDIKSWKIDPAQGFECLESRSDTSRGADSIPFVSIAHINADQLCVMGEKLALVDKGSSYRIGYWHWELPEFPRKYFAAFDFVDEVWVPSDHMLKALTKVSPVPVVKIPHSIRFSTGTNDARIRHSIPEKAFAFLCMYDLCSYQERKNPMGAVHAYIQAFPAAAKDHCLVIKVNNRDFDEVSFKALLAEVKGREDIVIVSQNLGREKVFQLENSIDCFVSLHRAEGFGLCAAECMYLGKPVIATAWSGNMEFMTNDNSYPVNYSLKALTENVGPYEAGQVWAEPDIGHAAFLMKAVIEDSSTRKQKARQAMRTIQEKFSPEAIGKRYKERLDTISEFHKSVKSVNG